MQICVHDDASGDSTREVVEAISRKDRRVRYYCNPTNIGAAANYQLALSRVNTPYFSVFADDDLLLPNFYSTALSTLERYPQAGFFCGRTVIFNEVVDVVYTYPRTWAAGYSAHGR
jgi:glycosyltransferase involved in cell wall biosynthesis